MSQWWRDIVFLHWRIYPDALAGRLPRGVAPDLHDGSAWVGLIPFRMVGAGIGRGGPVPYLGTFLETNVRVYTVDRQGGRGVVFLSLEAQRLLVVLAARLGFGVPYQWAAMRGVRAAGDPDTLIYSSTRRPLRSAGRRSGPSSRIVVRVGEAVREPSAQDLFLTARFGLHSSLLGAGLWVPNSHGPWPLHQATLLDLDDGLLESAGLRGLAARPPDSVLFSSGVRTTFGLPRLLTRWDAHPGPATRRGTATFRR
ncbi:MAG: DUF2071 domain-containing protein [Actinomycetota bacterium]|jgi:uncharacterized protein YqjF (DUF2071 family)|nr:DUF2071 domain-containing protein [Actinomycetota bacterium]